MSLAITAKYLKKSNGRGELVVKSQNHGYWVPDSSREYLTNKINTISNTNHMIVMHGIFNPYYASIFAVYGVFFRSPCQMSIPIWDPYT